MLNWTSERSKFVLSFQLIYWNTNAFSNMLERINLSNKLKITFSWLLLFDCTQYNNSPRVQLCVDLEAVSDSLFPALTYGWLISDSLKACLGLGYLWNHLYPSLRSKHRETNRGQIWHNGSGDPLPTSSQGSEPRKEQDKVVSLCSTAFPAAQRMKSIANSRCSNLHWVLS